MLREGGAVDEQSTEEHHEEGEQHLTQEQHGNEYLDAGIGRWDLGAYLGAYLGTQSSAAVVSRRDLGAHPEQRGDGARRADDAEAVERARAGEVEKAEPCEVARK